MHLELDMLFVDDQQQPTVNFFFLGTVLNLVGGRQLS